MQFPQVYNNFYNVGFFKIENIFTIPTNLQ